MIVICRGANFSANAIRTVTIKETASISISGDSSVTGMTSQLTSTATFKDGTTAAITPIWSIISGLQYATIDDAGLVTILPGASNAQVVIGAEYDGKTATKTMTVTYNFSLTLDVDVSDFTHYHGAAKSPNNEGWSQYSDQGAYSCILPCESGKTLNIKIGGTTLSRTTVDGNPNATPSITISGVTYYPRIKVYGFNENRYSESSTDNVAARVVRNSAHTAYNGHIFDGFTNSPSIAETQTVPIFPLTIPYQFDEELSASSANINVPYICIVVRFDKSDRTTRLTNLANYASQIDLQYIIS